MVVSSQAHLHCPAARNPAFQHIWTLRELLLLEKAQTMVNSDLERYYREQLTMLADLDWSASEDALVETLAQRCGQANLSPTIAGQVSRKILCSKGLDPAVADRIARRVSVYVGERSPRN